MKIDRINQFCAADRNQFRHPYYNRFDTSICSAAKGSPVCVGACSREEVASPPDPHEARMNKKAPEKSTRTTETSHPPANDALANPGGFGRGGQRIAIEARPAQNKESRNAEANKAGHYSFPTRCERSYSYCC